MDEPIPIGPEDQSIVLDGDNCVLFSDFPPHELSGDRSLLDDQEHPGQDIESIAKKRAAKEKLHLLDILDATSRDILRQITAAFDRPGQVVEREAVFRSEWRRVRIIHIDSKDDRLRTIIVIGPRRAE